jgi:hypothetical protein
MAMWNLASSVSSFANGLTGAPMMPATRGRHSTGSYNVSTKSQKIVAQKSMRSALAERGGVIRKADGFEVFYGINESADQKPLKAKPVPQVSQQPDGWDNFYHHDDLRQTPAKVEKVDWTTKHPNMTPEKENKDSPQKVSPKKSPSTPEEPESRNEEEQGEDVQVIEEGKDSDLTEEDDAQKENSPVVEPSLKPPTVCAFSIATPATSFAPPLTGRCTGMPDAEQKFRAECLEGDALAKHLMNRLSLGGKPFNSQVEAFSIHTPAASFAPPQLVTHKIRADSKASASESQSPSPTLSATVLEDDAPKNSTPRGEGKPTEARRVVKEVRAVATRAMAGIPERPSAITPSAITASSGYPSVPSQTNQPPRTFTISAARFPSVVASTGSTNISGRPSTGSVVNSVGSIKGRASVPGNFRPSNVTVRR